MDQVITIGFLDYCYNCLMHAYLITGNSDENINDKINELSIKLNAKVLNFSIIKIDDVRNLNSLVRLSFNEKTLIVIKNINLAGEEALNAFLKNLEEPQEKIYFVLTAPSESSVISTIVSRCQIVKTVSRQKSLVDSEEINKFLIMNKSEKLMYLGKIKERDDALTFINNLISYLFYEKKLNNMEILIKTLTNIKNNGNIQLHLTNLVAMLK